MNKKLLVLCLAAISSALLRAQTPQQMKESCGTGVPPQQWEDWISSKVEEYKKNLLGGKSQQVVHTIPVIVHIVSFNEPISTYPNIDFNQVKAQIDLLNKDFAGTGANVANVPPAFAGLVANTGIKFCLAEKDRQDLPLIPNGIDRISCQANAWQNVNTPGLDVQNYFNTVIIPATVWDPTKYLNIWVSDRPPASTLNGFSTLPPASGLVGVFGGSFGTISNDGIWIYAKYFGDNPTGAQAPFDLGRTTTHEVGHWLGLRHIWGDGNCLSDYCNDTPTHKAAHYGAVTTTPADQCGVGTSPNGEMPMNFMDMTDDAFRYMFTADQSMRMLTALSQSSLRYQLGNHNKCALPTGVPNASAVASFTTSSSQCLGQPFTPENNSSGFPYPTFVWNCIPSANFSPNNTVANPAITFNNPGFYTLSLVASNNLSSSTSTMLVSTQFTCGAQSLCIDSLRMLKNVDSLTRYEAPVNALVPGCGTGAAKGYLTGTNCYKDKEFAQFFPPSTYKNSIGNPQVNSVIVLFDTEGTESPNPGSQVICKIYGGTGATGPGGVQGFRSEPITSIVAIPPATSITYLGKPNVAPVNKFYPFKFDFTTPVIISSPSSGFFAGIQVPNAPGDSVSILSGSKVNAASDSSAWFMSANLSWRPLKSNRGYKVQLAIMPVVTCGAVGLKEEALNLFSSNINVMPNPSNGLFNVVFTLPEEQSLSMQVYDTMGQLVVSGELKNVMNNVVSLDLSDKPDGIYFTHFSNGRQKVVRKLVVSH